MIRDTFQPGAIPRAFCIDLVHTLPIIYELYLSVSMIEFIFLPFRIGAHIPELCKGG